MDSITESSLISSLEASDFTSVYDRFIHFLHPFSDFISTDFTNAPTSTKTRRITTKKKKEPDPNAVRPLAKKFLPFLSRILKMLPSILSSRPDDGNAPELLRVYRLALGCLSCISSCLAGKPYSVHLQRVRFLRCLEGCGQYGEAEREGFSILQSVREVIAGPLVTKKSKGKSVEVCILPEPMAENAADPDLRMLVVEVVVCVVTCVGKGRSNDSAVYWRVLDLVRQAMPWLRVLDSESSLKFHRALVSALYKCSLFMAGESTCFGGDLVHQLCMTTLTECLKSPLKDQFSKLACRVYSSLSMQWEGRSSLILDILRCALESIPCKCKVHMVYNVNDILDFVYNCSNSCRITSMDMCMDAAKIFKEIVLLPISPILNLYAAGLYFTIRDIQARDKGSIPEKSVSRIALLLGNGENIQYLATLGILASYFHNSSSNTGPLFGHAKKESTDVPCIGSVSDLEVLEVCKHMHGDISVSSYVNALEFLCKPFAEFVNTVWKHMVSEEEAVPLYAKYVQDAFHQFCDVFLTQFSNASEREREKLHECRKTLFHVAIAALRISLRTNGNTQKSINCIDRVVSRDWVHHHELKFLISSLYNIGVSLYNSKQLEKASIALALCYRVLWVHVLIICQKSQEEGVHDDHLSEDAIKDTVTDACAKSATFLDVLHQCGNPDMNEIIVSSLLNWSSASKILKKLAGPIALVKQWAKIMCKDFKDVGAGDDPPSLFSLLSSSHATCSKEALGLILEQELMAYAEMDARNPDLCQRMRLKIMDILLLDVYVTKDCYLQRSRVLVKKGRLLRACGIDGLSDCIHCLSEAISLVSDKSGDPLVTSALLCHHLALTYCLHALCIQERDQNWEVILHDVHCALKLWLSKNVMSHFSVDDDAEFMTEDAIPLLYHIADLLSLKGYLQFQYDIYKLIVILYKRKNVSLERCLAMLWGDRRLSHALCISPIDETFILNLSQEFGVYANSVDFWISCMEGFPPSLLGFRQKLFFSDYVLPQACSCHSNISLDSDATVDKVKVAASDLVSNVPIATHSAFLAGYLYYDLCERLLSRGKLFEAFSYAKEALRIRTRLLQRNFFCNSSQQSSKTIENHTNLEAIGSVITEVWPDNIKSWNIAGPILSPWSILKCYLESTLQVGIIHESIGNGAEAEAILLVGKKISCLQGLPLFEVSFASLLGRVYHKKQHWDLADSELNKAKQVLADSNTTLSCKRCKLALEVTIDMQIGDLSRSRLRTVEDHCPKNSSYSLEMYRSALQKLNPSELGNSSIYSETTTDIIMSGKTLDYRIGNTVCLSAKETRNVLGSNSVSSKCNNNSNCNGPNQCSLIVEGDVSHVNMDAKSKKSKNASRRVLQKQTSKAECNSRRTRATNRSSYSKIVLVESEVGIGPAEHTSHVCEFAGPVSQMGQHLLLTNCTADFGCDNIEAGSMQYFIYMKWQCHCKRLLLKLFRKIGKCTMVHAKVHEVHKVFWQSLCTLLNRNPSSESYSDAPDLLEFIGKDNSSDIFAIERATLLYDISWFTVKNCHSENPRTKCCHLSEVPISRTVTWLFHAFILCREFPMLLQKVSRLLSAIFLLSTFAEPFSSPVCTGKALSVSHWAAYFHQASLGTYMLHQYLSTMKGKLKSYNYRTLEGSCVSGSADSVLEAFSPFRYLPENVEDLEGFVINFFEHLPRVTIICISLLGRSYGNLLREMLPVHSSFPAWMLLSRFVSEKEKPVIMLLPVDLLVEESFPDDANCGMESISNSELCKKWQCPWGYTVVDDVAPQFKLILEENYLSSATVDPADTEKSRFTWWTWRTKLNHQLDKFLRNMEDSWLGPWRCLLLGNHSNCELVDKIHVKLIDDLKRKCKIEAHESLLKAILCGAGSVAESEACVSQLFSYKGYLGRGNYCGKEIFGSTSAYSEIGISCGLPHQMILEAMGVVAEEDVEREPVVLVLDADVHMLPWENLPILRKQEVYRMPSISSISMALDRNCGHQEPVSGTAATFPSIDPLDAYYLLNPSGDLSSSQVEFEEWFREQKWEGKAGNVPPTEELALALQNHDLFIYVGHGSGTQYIPGHEIQKLDHCAATLLMGCSSGSLSFTGSYSPQGAPLSYILAGSPAIIANLWDVTDKDIDRFSRAMLDAWLQEKSTPPTHCIRCKHMVEEFRCMKLADKAKASVPKTRKKNLKVEKLQDTCNDTECRHCGENLRIASFMSKARDACRLPLLVGASPVCYGVPTIVRKKK